MNSRTKLDTFQRIKRGTRNVEDLVMRPPMPHFPSGPTDGHSIITVRVTTDKGMNPYYKGVFVYEWPDPDTGSHRWYDGVEGEECWIMGLNDETLTVSPDAATGPRYEGRISDAVETPEGDGSVPGACLVRVVVGSGGGVADTVQTVEWDAVTAFDPDACEVTTTHFTLTLTVAAGVITLGLVES